MKQIFTFIAAMLLAQFSFGQTYLFEDFSGSAFPPAGWTRDGVVNQWTKSATASAGGTSPELKFTYVNQNTTTRFISPVVDLAGESNVTLTFNYFYDYYAAGVTFGVAKRFGTGDWEVVWSVNPTGNQGPMLKTVEFTNVGQPGFQFCYYLTGNLYNIDYLFIDNVKVFKRKNLDAGLQSLNVPSYFTGQKNVTGKVINEGLTAISSFDVNWTLNDGATNTTTFSGLNLATDNTFTYTCSQTLNPPAGVHTLKVWVSNVNGVAQDDNPANDMIQKTIGIPTQTMQRRPLFEEFTSSTCAPCASFNNSVFNPFIATNGENIGLIKYQMNWPGTGDPYYTAEGGVRRTFYGVNAVPMLYTEGLNVSTSAAAVNNAYNTAMADPAFVQISATHNVDGDNFSVSAQVTPYVTLNNATVHVVFIEKLTTGNVASNGETSFHHVMMKMMPDANGTTTTLEGGVPTTFNFTHNMSTTHVEEMDDLVAVVFVQDNASKYVFNSAYSTEGGALPATVSFDPVNGATGITTEVDLHIAFNMPVLMTGGAEITNANVGSLVTLKKVNGANHPFVATISDDKTTITVNPDGLLNSFTQYQLGVADVQNANGVVTPASSVTFETGIHVGVQETEAGFAGISPNPANGNLEIRFYQANSGNVMLSVHDLSGRMVSMIHNGEITNGMHTIQWNTTGLTAGAYLVKMQTGNTVKTSRLIVNN